MLIGTFEHNMDAKGRLQIPSQLRDELGDSFIGTKGTGTCLFIFSVNQWDNLCDKLRALPISSSAAQSFMRMLAANATEFNPDAHGRILIPKHLRERIGLEKEAIIAGVLTRVEIWSKSAWEEYTAASDQDYEHMLTQLQSLGV